MEIIDKNKILTKISGKKPINLELGCGDRKHSSKYIGIDMLDYECVDIIGDVYEVLPVIPDGVVDEVYSSHFIEHVTDLPLLVNELARIIKKHGKLIIVAPHFSNPYFYSDWTHKTSFGLYSMSYFSKDSKLSRKVPTYQRELKFSLIKIKLIFKSSPPFYVRHLLKRFIEFIVNINIYTREFYEELFCYWFPCYEIKYELQRL